MPHVHGANPVGFIICLFTNIFLHHGRHERQSSFRHEPGVHCNCIYWDLSILVRPHLHRAKKNLSRWHVDPMRCTAPHRHLGCSDIIFWWPLGTSRSLHYLVTHLLDEYRTDRVLHCFRNQLCPTTAAQCCLGQERIPAG